MTFPGRSRALSKNRLEKDDLQSFLNAANRSLLLQAFAVGVVGYALIVLVYANTVPHLGLQVFGRVVRAAAVAPAIGPTPNQGDVVTSFAGRAIDSFPLYVNTLAYLNVERRFPSAKLDSLEELSATDSTLVQIGANRFVKLEFESAGDPTKRYSSWFLIGDLPWQTTAGALVWCVFQSFVFWMAFVVHRRRPDDHSAAIFLLTCIVTVGAYMGGFFWLEIASSPALLFVFAICAMALPQVTLHFFLVYPTPKEFLAKQPRLVSWSLYVVPAVVQILILMTIGNVVSSFRQEQPVARIDQFLRLLLWFVTIYLGMSMAMFAGCLASLVHSFFSARLPIHRNQVRWILGGALLASLFLAYSFWLALEDPLEFALGGATWSMIAASLVFTIAYTVSIARYRMMIADDVMQRGVHYVVLTFMGTLAYYGLLFLAVVMSPRLAPSKSLGQVMLAGLVVIFVLFVLTALGARIRVILDRRFFREKKNLDRAMKRMDEAVGQLVKRDTVLRRSLLALWDVLAPPDVAAYLRTDNGATFELAHQVGSSPFPKSFAKDSLLVRILDRKDLLQTNPAPALAGDPVSAALRREHLELVQALRHDDRLLGFIAIRPRPDGLYSSTELDFITSFAEMTSLALQTSETQRTLEILNEELRGKIDRLSRQKQLRELQNQSAVPFVLVEGGREEAIPAIQSIKGSGPQYVELIRTVRKIADSSATVLLRGESGTGKSALAEVIHRNSPRAAGPFVSVHCAALSPGILESELFGHVKGAFTGAHKDKEGRFQAADKGTIFLDEIGDLSPDLQVKLLRVLQEMSFEPVGSNETIKVDVRVIAATHQPLEDLVRRNKLREDLFYRLNVISMFVPPLRERREDIVELALHFLEKAKAKSKKPLEGIDEEALEILLGYDWPGNIRELENAIERAAVMTSGPSITSKDLPTELVERRYLRPVASPRLSYSEVIPRETDRPVGTRSAGGAALLEGELDELERSRLLDALAAGGGNKSKAAHILGLPRSTFCSKLKKHGLA